MELKEFGYNGHLVRTLEIDGKIYFVANDVAKVLGYKNTSDATNKYCKKAIKRRGRDSRGRRQEFKVVPESDVYRLIIKSKLPEAERFEEWVMEELLPTLRKQSGLEGFEVFRMLDKEHQKEQMEILRNAYEEPRKENYIKANTLANKAASNYYGFSKMVKKEDMTPEMLVTREKILEDAVKLLEMQEQFGLEHISQMLYKKWRKEK